MEANYLTISWWFLPYIYMNLPWVFMCSPSWTSLPPSSPSHPSGSSQCTSPEHPVFRKKKTPELESRTLQVRKLTHPQRMLKYVCAFPVPRVFYILFEAILLWPLCEYAKSLQSHPTLGDPIDCSRPSSTVHGILQARVLEWGCHFLLQGIFLTQGSIWHLLHCMQILYHWASGKAPLWGWVGGRYASSGSKKLTPVAEEYPL